MCAGRAARASEDRGCLRDATDLPDFFGLRGAEGTRAKISMLILTSKPFARSKIHVQEIPREQVRRRLATENPWWREPHGVSSFFLQWTPRPYLDLFLPLLVQRSIRRAVVLMGPRRVV